MKIGVFGGSFDPVHVGHLIVAEAAADALRLDRVLFVPAHIQPFKIGVHQASPDDRVAMLRAAIAGNPRFVLDLREIERGGPSYTSVTLRELADEHPADELCLMVGADAANDLPHWHEVEEIPRFATVAVLSRPGEATRERLAGTIDVLVPAVDISATLVRERVRSGRSIRYLVPATVADYIAKHSLYTD